jgi:hypothetical protein
MYVGAEEAGSFGKLSRNPSPFMLTGVLAVSSVRMKEAWLSEEACRAGISKLGVPARLNGLEKLKEGRGNPEASEHIEGDRWYGGKAGDIMPMLLVLESLRAGWE